MSDSTFEALANIPGHLSSFAASAQDGKVVQSSEGSTNTEKTSLAAYQLLGDATILAKLTPELQQDKLKRITVTFPSQYHVFTVSDDTIYGIERTNNVSAQ
ncbi:hypothetical protein INT47_002697 [Mucor saturninus]|uniref:Uncharacterized protein n=1 Tax=Mucor saturninus TaxID=64648 RepID=A0A8H7UZB1_9FUNG|nr:hypothetical protein INT47_002697 [Mucor saturninus]